MRPNEIRDLGVDEIHDQVAKLREELLDLRLKDLKVKLGGKLLEGCLHRLEAELTMRGLRFMPHVWVSDEFFSPRGVGGLAVPFYLCHPRLTRLEKKQMLEVEGGSKQDSGHDRQHGSGSAQEFCELRREPKPGKAWCEQAAAYE